MRERVREIGWRMTSRGAVSSATSTSTSSPAATPAAARFSELSGTRNRPPIAAMVVLYVWSPILIWAEGRFPEASAETTASGTCRPVAVFPPSSTVVRDFMSAIWLRRKHASTSEPSED
jgi:hypothetical protein